MNTKMVVVIRKDLHVRKGKMMAQACHAAVNILLQSIRMYLDKNEEQAPEYIFEPNDDMLNWLATGATKICVGIDSEAKLKEVYEMAKSNNLPCDLVQDTGRTEFYGVPTYTAVAIGPAQSNLIDEITGDLALL